MKRDVFESLDCDTLGWECIKPAIMQVRGQGPVIKQQIYSQLNKGQQALFIFRVYYNHASKSPTEFHWWSVNFFTQSIWPEIKKGLQYFNDNSILRLLEELEALFKARNWQENTDINRLFNGLENNSELHNAVDQIYRKFQEVAPATLKLIGEYIRNHPDEFVQFED